MYISNSILKIILTKEIKFTQYLLTRFNLNYGASVQYICDEDWHHHRFEIFNRYCLPSVLGQTHSNFKWIIFFNDDLKKTYQTFIDETSQKSENIHFIFVKPGENHRKLFLDYINEQVKNLYLITTRMDNDDAISRYFIEKIQQKFLETNSKIAEPEFVINSGNGFQNELIFPYRKAIISGYHHSPFISIASKRDHSGFFKTAIDNSHHLWGDEITTVETGDEKLWVQIIHEKNLANRVKSLSLVSTIPEEEFPVLKNEINRSNLPFFLLLPVQFLITFFQKIYSKIRFS